MIIYLYEILYYMIFIYFVGYNMYAFMYLISIDYTLFEFTFSVIRKTT